MHTICQLENFKIIYQDDYLVAIHKPAGLLVHPSPIDKHETQFATQILEALLNMPVFPIHRLDKATSGILLFALDSKTANQVSQQMQNQLIQKRYVSIVRGWIAEIGETHLPLKQHFDKMVKQSQTDKPDQSASTYWKRLDTSTLEIPLNKFSSQRYSLIELSPTTGRKHQLRRHLNALSYPIIGDVSHGDRNHNHLFNEQLGQHRLYLAATELHLTHPFTNKPLSITAPLESSFVKACEFLNFNLP